MPMKALCSTECGLGVGDLQIAAARTKFIHGLMAVAVSVVALETQQGHRAPVQELGDML